MQAKTNRRPSLRFGEVRLLSAPRKSDDWTTFLDKEEFVDAFRDVEASDEDSRKRAVEQILPEIMGLDGETQFVFEGEIRGQGRYNVVRCFEGWFAVTLRGVKAGPPSRQISIPFPLQDVQSYVDSLLCIDNRHADGYLSSARASGECLYELTKDRSAGLVLITGSTGSGKTLFLNALVRRHLVEILSRAERADNEAKKNSPHIVVVGDPVETWLFRNRKVSTPGDIARLQREAGDTERLRFTARTIGRDVESVDQATQDALRQTPAMFVISELRRDADFRAALRLAGTGHLVLATSHATSLIDAMAQLMRVEMADSSKQRALLAQRLAAVVFLKPYELREGDAPEVEGYKATVPRIWRGNAHGCRAFVSEGLSSLQVSGPARENERQGEERHAGGVVGFFTTVNSLSKVEKGAEYDKRWKHLKQLANRWDLYQDSE